jgi:hypothetical protein
MARFEFLRPRVVSITPSRIVALAAVIATKRREHEVIRLRFPCEFLQVHKRFVRGSEERYVSDLPGLRWPLV